MQMRRVLFIFGMFFCAAAVLLFGGSVFALRAGHVDLVVGLSNSALLFAMLAAGLVLLSAKRR